MKKFLPFLIFFIPLVTFAAPTNLLDLITIFLNLIGDVIPLLASLTFLFFVWGLVKFLAKGSDPKARIEGRKFMIWSVIILFVWVSLFAIIIFAKDQFEFEGGTGYPLLPEN